MADSSEQSTSNLRKKACTECRQQKAKCDAYLDPDSPCSRCRRTKTQCVILAPFKRENKRQRLSELEQETDSLRKKLMTGPGDGLRSSNTALSVTSDRNASHAPAPSIEIPPHDTQAVFFDNTPPVPAYSETPDRHLAAETAVSTVPRTLEGVLVSAKDIDSIFSLYFRYYSPFLPILDPRLTPNTCYQQSPLLFWAIIGTACRSYHDNPTLLNALCQDIAKLALLSAMSSKAPLQRIQAFLLLLTWPFPDPPTDSLSGQQEVSFVLGGLLLHLAMRGGLHIPKRSEEFFRARGPNLPDIGLNQRSELWTQCVLAYQRSCLCKGFLSRTSHDISPEMARFQVAHQTLSPELRMQLKVQDIAIDCGAAVAENGVRDLAPEQDRALSTLIRTFETRMKNLEMEATTDFDMIMCQWSKLHIHIFYLFKQDTTAFPEIFDKIQRTSRQVIRDVEKLIHKSQDPASLPYYICCALFFAAFCLLRILKASIPLLSGDDEEAKSTLFLAISLTKQTSSDSNDTSSKCAKYLTQLWNSSRAFKNADGSDYLQFRARSRLSGCIIVDAILWWREEFDPQFKKQMQASKAESNGIASHQNLDGVTPGPADLANNQQPFMDSSNDAGLFDFDWFTDTNLFLPHDLFGFPGANGEAFNN